jgi:RimJ/RimL family protein N-acetyltransferase
VQPLPTLETERLVLRPLAPEDAAAVRALGGDRCVAEMTLLPHPFGEEEVRRWVQGRLEWAAQGKSRPFSVVLRGTARWSTTPGSSLTGTTRRPGSTTG